MLYVFDNYELDPQLYELRRAGTPVSLEPLVFNVLVYLVQHHDRVVTKQELFEHCWPDQFVGDAAVERCIRAARQALGDTGKAQHTIHTLHGRGYRFRVHVEKRFPLPPPGPSPPAPQPPTPPDDDALQRVKPAPPHRHARDGERKWVTVLCCAIVDAVSLTEGLGAEAMHTLLQQFFALARSEIDRYEGTLTHVLGDGFMALFGAPVAHEDHAQRAVLAALGVQQQLHAQRAVFGLPDGVALRVRMGVHTGRVVVGYIGTEHRLDYTAVGNTTHLAARLQDRAEPGTILMSATTCRAVEGAVRLEALTPVRVHGTDEPVLVYKVLEATGRGLPRAGRIAHRLSRFVGREREVAVLHDLLTQIEDGHGQVVGIVGEPGLGKSRLLMEFRQSLRDKPVTYLEGHCLSYGRAFPYLPVCDIVRAHCHITEADAPEAIIAKVRLGLQEVGLDPEDKAPYLLQLLGVPEDAERLALLTPEAIKVRTFETFHQMCLRRSQHQPLIVAVEDVHWMDATSEAVFTALVERLTGASLLFLTTSRPGYRPPWGEQSYATQLALHRLPPTDSRAVVHAVAQQQPLSDALVQTILRKAEGNPLFLEELTCAAVEHDPLRADLPVPETIQGVLMARIDRLPAAAKRALQTAAVLGQEVAVPLLERLWEGPEALAPQLEVLQRLEFLYARTAAEPVYGFKHPLTQEVAYDSLLLARRQALHAAAGRALEALYAERLEEFTDRLAYHYARTTEAATAVAYLTRLAEQAARKCAHAEAVTALQEALRQIETLPLEAQDRSVADVGLRLVDSLHYLGRFPESLDVLLRQQAQLAQHQDIASVGLYHVQLGFTYSMLGEPERAVESAQRALAAARHHQDPVTMGRAQYVLALASYWSGRPQRGIAHGQQAIAVLEQTDERESLGMAYFYLGVNHALLGDFAATLAAVSQTQALGEALEDPALQCYVAWLTGWIQAMQGDWAPGIARCQHSLAHSPHPLNTVLTLSTLGYVYLEQGEPAEAISLLEQALQLTDQFQYRPLQGWVTTLLGEAYGGHGQLEAASALARQGLDISRSVMYWPGVGVAQRALGRIAQRQGALTEAAQYFQEALETFGAMPARYELGRTHLDLAALAHAQGALTTAATQLTAAHTLFTALRIPYYVVRTAQHASALGVVLRGGQYQRLTPPSTA